MSRSKKVLFLVVALLAGLVFAANPAAAEDRPVAAEKDLPQDLKDVTVSHQFVPHSGPRVGFVQSQIGVVVIRHEKTGPAYFSAEGDTLFKGDVIYTLRGSKIRLNVKNEDIINLAEESTFQIKDVFRDRKEKKRRSLFSIVKGKAMFYVLRLLKYRDAQADVETPTATAGIRGTKFALEIRQRSPQAGLGGLKLAANGDVPIGPLAQAPGAGVEVIGTCLDGTIYMQHHATGNVVYVPAGFTATAGGVDVTPPDPTDPGYLQQLMDDTNVGPQVQAAVAAAQEAGDEGGLGEGEVITIPPPDDTVTNVNQQPLDEGSAEPQYDYYGFYGAVMAEYPGFSAPTYAETYYTPTGQPVFDPHNLTATGTGNLLIDTWVLKEASYAGGSSTSLNVGLTQTLYGFYFTMVDNTWPVSFMAWGTWKAGDFTINPDVGIRPMGGGWVEGAQLPEDVRATLLGSSQIYNYAGFSSGYLWSEAGGFYEEVLSGDFSATLDFSSGTYGTVQNFALNSYGPNYAAIVSGGSGALDEFGNFMISGGTWEIRKDWAGDYSSYAASTKVAAGMLFGVDEITNSLGGGWYIDAPDLYARGGFGGLHNGSLYPQPAIPVGWYNGMMLDEGEGYLWADSFNNMVPGDEPRPQSFQAAGHYLGEMSGGTDFLWADDPAAGQGLSGYLRAASTLGLTDYDLNATITTSSYGSVGYINYGWWQVTDYIDLAGEGTNLFVPWGGWVEMTRIRPDTIDDYASEPRKVLYDGTARGFVYNDFDQSMSQVSGNFHAWLNFGYMGSEDSVIARFDLYAYDATNSHYATITGASGDLQEDGDFYLTSGNFKVDGAITSSAYVAGSLAYGGGMGGTWDLLGGSAYASGVFAGGAKINYIEGATPQRNYATSIVLNPSYTGTNFQDFFWWEDFNKDFDTHLYGMLTPYTDPDTGYMFFKKASGRDGALLLDAVLDPVGTYYIGNYRSSPEDIWNYDLGAYGSGEYMSWGLYWTGPFYLTDHHLGESKELIIPWGAGLWLDGDKTSGADLASLQSGEASYAYRGFSRGYLFYNHPMEQSKIEEILEGQFGANINFGTGAISGFGVWLKGPTYEFYAKDGTGTLGADGAYSIANGTWDITRPGFGVDGSITTFEAQGDVFGPGGLGTGGMFVASGTNNSYPIYINGVFGGQDTARDGAFSYPNVGAGYYVHMLLETDGSDFTGYANTFYNQYPMSYDVTTQRFIGGGTDFFIAKDADGDPNSGAGQLIVDAQVGAYSNGDLEAPVTGTELGSFTTTAGHEFMDWGWGYTPDSFALTDTGGGSIQVQAPMYASWWLNGERPTDWPIEFWTENGGSFALPYSYEHTYAGPAYAFIYRSDVSPGSPEAYEMLQGDFWAKLIFEAPGGNKIAQMSIITKGETHGNWAWVKDVGPVDIGPWYDFTYQDTVSPSALVDEIEQNVYIAGSLFGPSFSPADGPLGLGGYWYTDPSSMDNWVVGIFAGEQGALPDITMGYYTGLQVSYNDWRGFGYDRIWLGGPVPKVFPWFNLGSVEDPDDMFNVDGSHVAAGLGGALDWVQFSIYSEEVDAPITTTTVQTYTNASGEYMSYGKWHLDFSVTFSDGGDYGVRPQAGLWMEGVQTQYDDIQTMMATTMTTFYRGPVDGYLYFGGIDMYEEALKGHFEAKITWGSGAATLDEFSMYAWGPNFLLDPAWTSSPGMGAPLGSTGSFNLDDGTTFVQGQLFGQDGAGMGGYWYHYDVATYANGVLAGEKNADPLSEPQIPIGFYSGMLKNSSQNTYAQTHKNYDIFLDGEAYPQSADIAGHPLDDRETGMEAGMLDGEDMSLGQGMSGEIVRGSWYDSGTGKYYDTRYEGFQDDRPEITTVVDGSFTGSGEYLWFGRWYTETFQMADSENQSYKENFLVPQNAGFWVEGDRTTIDRLDAASGVSARYFYSGNNVVGFLWDSDVALSATLAGGFSAWLDFGQGDFGVVDDFRLNASGSNAMHDYTVSIAAYGDLDSSGYFSLDGTGRIHRESGEPGDDFLADYMGVYGNTFGPDINGIAGIWELGNTTWEEPEIHANGYFAGQRPAETGESAGFYNGTLAVSCTAVTDWRVADYYFNANPQDPAAENHSIWQQHPDADSSHLLNAYDPAPVGPGFSGDLHNAWWKNVWWSDYGTLGETYYANYFDEPITTVSTGDAPHTGQLTGSGVYLSWGYWSVDEFEMSTASENTKRFQVPRGYWMEGEMTSAAAIANELRVLKYSGDAWAFGWGSMMGSATSTGSFSSYVDFGQGKVFGFDLDTGIADIRGAQGDLNADGTFYLSGGWWYMTGLTPSYTSARGAIWGPNFNAMAGLFEMSYCGSLEMVVGGFAGDNPVVNAAVPTGYYTSLMVHDDGEGGNWQTAAIMHNLDPDYAFAYTHILEEPPAGDSYLVTEENNPLDDPGPGEYLRNAAHNGNVNDAVDKPVNTFTAGQYSFAGGEYLRWGYWQVGNSEDTFNIPGTGENFYVPRGFYVEGHRTPADRIAQLNASYLYSGGTTGYIHDDTTGAGQTLAGSFNATLNFGTMKVEGFHVDASGGLYAVNIDSAGDINSDGTFAIDTTSGTWELQELFNGMNTHNATERDARGAVFGPDADAAAGTWKAGNETLRATGEFHGTQGD